MPKPRIILPPRLAPPHLAAVLKYFEATDRLSAGEWKLALEAFDVLGSATLMTRRRSRSFRQFYESTVERRHADRFLTEMLAADDPEVKGALLLVVDRRLGDIKHTTYFLYMARSLPLKCDFYITQLYHAQRRRYVRIVILTEESWHDLNGPVKAATLETAADFFPEPVQIVFEGRRFVVVTFDLWKDRVKRRQEREN